MCSRDAADTPRGAVDQEACKERLFTVKSQDYQRSQEGREEEKEVGGASEETIMRIPRMCHGTLSLLKPRVSRSVPTLTPPAPGPPNRIRPISSCNNCRSWRRCRPSGNCASASSKCGRSGGHAAQSASPKYWLLQNTSLNSGVEYRTAPSLFRRRVIPTFFFPSRRCCEYLAHEIRTVPSIHPSSLPFPALFWLLWVPHLLQSLPISLSHDLTITHIFYFCLI